MIFSHLSLCVFDFLLVFSWINPKREIDRHTLPTRCHVSHCLVLSFTYIQYTYRSARKICILFVYFEIETEKKQTKNHLYMKNTRAVANYRWSRVCVNPHRMLENAMRACPAGVCHCVCVWIIPLFPMWHIQMEMGPVRGITNTEKKSHSFSLTEIVCVFRARTQAHRNSWWACVDATDGWTSLVVLFFFFFFLHMCSNGCLCVIHSAACLTRAKAPFL